MKDAKGHGSDPHGAHSTGVIALGYREHLTAQERAAMTDYNANVEARGDRWGTSKSVLPSGHELYTSIRPRQSNSRGARRGGHLATYFSVRAPGEQYSKNVGRDKIKDHFK